MKRNLARLGGRHGIELKCLHLPALWIRLPKGAGNR